MDLSAGALFSSLLVSTIGFSLFIYGKKQGRYPQLAGGLLMMVYPFAVPQALPMMLIFFAIVGGIWFACRQGY